MALGAHSVPLGRVLACGGTGVDCLPATADYLSGYPLCVVFYVVGGRPLCSRFVLVLYIVNVDLSFPLIRIRTFMDTLCAICMAYVFVLYACVTLINNNET
jgi:hypothetical protein